MQIKINEKILSIPPYISTTWSHIAALHMKGNLFVVTLTDGETINISGLQSEIIELIFNYHAAYLEKTNLNSIHTNPLIEQSKLDSLSGLLETESEAPIRLAFGSPDGLNSAMQHNPAQANAPDLPLELLQKISAIAKVIAPIEEFAPKAEPGCNCFHCQIARVINPLAVAMEETHDEEIKDEELQFQQWTITQTGDKLFSVTNRLDTHEKYNVYLGQPVGCTCGQDGCEHILAVLKS